MIKIIETKIYRGVPVVDAELVLVECEGWQAFFFKDTDGKLIHHDGYGGAPREYYRPILISRTEKIEVGDWVLWKGKILQAKSEHTNVAIKILALPEHFSPKHLQAIVDGKLKEGKVLVECGEPCQLDKDYEGGYDCAYCKRKGMDFGDCTSKDNVIKLNSSNHITPHKVEEKMVPESRVIDFLKWLPKDHGHKFSNELDAWEWFEQNVK